jgi:outer membrane protein TolC
LLASALVGCSTEYYRKSADRETAAAIQGKVHRVPNMDNKFALGGGAPLSLAGLPANSKGAGFLGADGESEKGARIVSLEKALEIAVKYSPIYQNRKEQLYLSALDVTLVRHQFTPIFTSDNQAERMVNNGRSISLEPDPKNPTNTILTERMVEDHWVTGSGGVDADWLIRDFGKITAAASTDFLRFLTGDSRAVASSQLAATFSRPLLRDSGFKSEVENLTQADRNLLYAMREYTRFRKSFSVGIATSYYRVLSSRDMVRNAYGSYQDARNNVERSHALADEGRSTKSDLGRLEQDALNKEATWSGAVRSYKSALDEFKIQLGVPGETRVVLDDRELEQLKIEDPTISLKDAIKIGTTTRLDLLTLCDEYQDAKRKVPLAADALRTQLDLVGGAAIDSDQVRRGFPVPNPANYEWSAGVNLDLPLDRKAERNNYRASLIACERAKREVLLSRDNIELQIRESYRALDDDRRNYELNKKAVELAQRRVEEQQLRSELGLSRAQDQVDAQHDLVDSQNKLTQALVSHTIERLNFWENMDILYIKDNGKWGTQR